MTTVAADAIAELQDVCSGDVLEPGSPGYEQARRVHNGLIDKRPAVIVRCRHTADVADAVQFGRSHRMEISVRGGGHNVAGLAVTDGGLMIDLAEMRGIHVDPRARTAWAQPGLNWGEFNRATALHGLATTGGVISTTGIAGLTLGGGLGWLMGKHGMAVDNLLGAEVVLASGDVVDVTEETDPDLFWAIRGGGGNFGVATSFRYRLHPLETVLGGPVIHPLEAAPDVLQFYRDHTPEIPDEMTLFWSMQYAPDGSGTKLCAMALCHSGEDTAKAEADARPVREHGSPVMDMVERMPYPVLNTALDEAFPPGALNYWKTAFLAEVPDTLGSVLVEAFERAPTQMCMILIEHFHGAVTRVDPQAMAFPHRQHGYNLVISAEWTDPAQTEECIRWARETFAAVEPYTADRSYVNYLGQEDAGRVRGAYGPNYDRLVELKRRYDPDNVFRLNLNIDPNG